VDFTHLVNQRPDFLHILARAKFFADRIRAYIPKENGDYVVLGTDGFGRSDSRANLRSFFEVDRYHVAVAALDALAKQGKVGKDVVQKAIEKYGVQTEVAPSWKR